MKTEKNVRYRRDVIKHALHGKIVYTVKYITEYETIRYFLGHKTGSNIDVQEEMSNIHFNSQKEAEEYAQNTYQCDELYGTLTVIVYLSKGEKFKNYGDFHVWKENFHLYFSFDDEKKYGSAIWAKNKYTIFKDLDNVIDEVEKRINTLGSEEVVSSYDYTAMKTIPYDQLKASSEELEELNKLLQQYRNDMKQYQDFLEKLLKKD